MYMEPKENLILDFNKIKDYDFLAMPLDFWQEMTSYNETLQEEITKRYHELEKKTPKIYEQFVDMVKTHDTICPSEILRMVKYISRDDANKLLEKLANEKVVETLKYGYRILDKDKLLNEISKFEVSHNKCQNKNDYLKDIFSDSKISISFLQRKFDIGYARASQILDYLIENNYVEQTDGYKYLISNKDKVIEFFNQNMRTGGYLNKNTTLPTSSQETSTVRKKVESITQKQYEQIEELINTETFSVNKFQEIAEAGYARTRNTLDELEEIKAIKLKGLNNPEILDKTTLKSYLKKLICD